MLTLQMLQNDWKKIIEHCIENNRVSVEEADAYLHTLRPYILFHDVLDLTINNVDSATVYSLSDKYSGILSDTIAELYGERLYVVIVHQSQFE